ncbi:ethanolamine ammonia-lyase [Hydrogenophaga crassostreae]|uniref:Ethanolamine ammonia-lyase small subunit n=1 Tax=Hydrogenophaga crassostreae TaxID=1763535 RepID=A0A167I6P6_9BURK|nr:ethanolamine ammonia-lyase subunit EutC [Hydrogenophaga crassostreae]AOW11876.1 ethanolamine ammonia-lyase [Hydrogenophaga crassostreae]OAD42276.1 ethanolamine ammonia-lyase [Hydrogenophaga crassostreae]
MTTPANWNQLRAFTDARIALGRAGVSQPTRAHLAFQLAHAQARDAVHGQLDVSGLQPALEALGQRAVHLHSAAPDRAHYLQRPDWGRRLNEASREKLLALRPAEGAAPFDLAVVVADGLSPLAVQRHAPALLAHLLPLLRADGATQSWHLAPLAMVEQARVAVGDEVGECLGARCVLVLIGERPGLSSPDSLGGYFTWAPRVGRSDAERNCISNVRDAGLAPEKAARKLHTLLCEARRRELSGIALKDESTDGLDHAKGIPPEKLPLR